jgi:hypothetical protein
MKAWLLLMGVVFFILLGVSQGREYRATKKPGQLVLAICSVGVAFLMLWAALLAFRQP